MKVEVSKEWTDEERLRVCALIGVKLRQNFDTREKIVFYGECLYLIATSPPEFLQANRDKYQEFLKD